MKNLETQIEINATPEEVWSVLIDFANYPGWNPFIESISGEPANGSNLSVSIKQGEKNSMKFEPVVLQSKRAEEFRWKGKLYLEGLFDGEHYFILNRTSDSKTEFIHGEKFSGLLSGVLFKMIGKQTQAGFIAMNNALKTRVEQNSN